MQAFTQFSQHAAGRVAQRTSLTCDTISTLIDRKLYVDLGSKPGLSKSHLLFYSNLDDQCFVAIRDELTGTIITVLPLEYHENLAWAVSNEACERAKCIYLSEQARLAKNWYAHKERSFRIRAQYTNKKGISRVQVILKVSSVKYHNDFRIFLADDAIFGQIDTIASAKGVPVERLICIMVQDGSDGKVQVVERKYIH